MKKLSFLLALTLVLISNFLYDGFKNSDYRYLSTYYFGSNSNFEYTAKIATVEDGLVVAGREKLLFYDSKGVEKWEKPLFSYSSIMDAKGDVIAICEPHSGELYILNREGQQVYQNLGLDRLVDVNVFDDGSVCAISDKGIAYIYSISLGKLLEIELQSSFVIDFDYVDSTKKLSVLTLDEDLNFYLNTYSASGEIVAGVIIDQAMAFGIKSFEDKSIVMTEFGKMELNEDMEVVYFNKDSTKMDDENQEEAVPKLSYFDIEQNIEVYEQAGNSQIYMDEDRFQQGNQNSKEKKEKGETGKDQDSKQGGLFFPGQVSRLFKLGKNILLTDGNSILLMDTKGKELKRFSEKDGSKSSQNSSFSAKILDVKKIDENSFAICYSNKIDFYRKGK